MSDKRNVAFVITLDTKAAVAEFVRGEIESWGLNVILIDPGILGEPSVKAEYSRYDVAKAAGTTLEELRATKNKGVCIATQTQGVINIVQRLHAEGRLQGIISCGGGQGTSIGTAAMRALPVGVPKLMLSTVACGFFRFGWFVGTKDIAMMHSVTDILDVNTVSRPILRNAANAIAGMVLRDPPIAPDERPAIAITQLGMTTPCIMRVKALLEKQGYQIVPFHASGAGGPSMEELIEAGRFVGMMDISVHEITDGLFDGNAGSKNRLESLARVNIPAIVSVGGLEYLLAGNVNDIPERWRGRQIMVHNAQMTTVMPNVEEMRAAARYLVDRVNSAIGPTIVAVPTVGFIDPNQPGREFYQPENTQAVIEELQGGLKVPLVLVDAHINDPIFADVLADSMVRLLNGEAPAQVAARYQKGSN